MQAYNAHKLLGAVIENCRDSDHFGAAVWDGKRMHTLEGFLSADAAEASAIDVINMLSAISGTPAVNLADSKPAPKLIYGHAHDEDAEAGPGPYLPAVLLFSNLDVMKIPMKIKRIIELFF